MASRYTYETIKALAKETKRTIKELLALAPQNDPFYVGTETTVKQGEWFAKLWKDAGYSTGVHLRRAHYWAVSRAPLMHTGEVYENTEKCWGYLAQASKMARYLGLVRIEDVVDHKNPAPFITNSYWDMDGAEYSIEVPELNAPSIYISGISNEVAQPYHLELWCEKSTMNDVLEPICRRYGANLATFEGEVSITSCNSLLSRIARSGGKPTRIFYISDFDPAGNSMPVAMSRKVEFMLSLFERDYDVRLKPIVLTAEQIERYQLPRTPIKDTEKRAAKFETAFGQGAVELDALEAIYPGQLAQIVTAALSPYWNHDAANAVFRQQDALQQAISVQIEAITGRYQAEIAALETMFDELREVQISAAAYGVECYEPHVDENEKDWLFNSERDYTDQIAYYKAHKGIDAA